MTTPGFSQRVSQLLEPIGGDLPCGANLHFDAATARMEELRREDDTSLAQGIWSTAEVKRADWHGLELLASDVLATRSKDLKIAAFLGEAWLHREGVLAIVDALALIGGLCERFPDEIHPQPEDGDLEWRAAPLEWMAPRYEHILLARLSLFPEGVGDVERFSLHEWQQMKLRQVQINDSKPAKVAAEAAQAQQKKISEAVRKTPAGWWIKGAQAMQTGQAQLLLLDGWCDRHLGECAPGFARLRSVMQALEGLFKEFIALHPPQVFPAEAAEPQPESPPPMDAFAAEPRLPFAEPRNRDEAYRQLLVIADYLARSEPHSPVPYLIRRGVEWGNKPLRELLAELISSDAEARRLWTLMGVL